MTQFINTLFSLFFLLLLVGCTSVESVSPPQQINVDSLKEQLKELQKPLCMKPKNGVEIKPSGQQHKKYVKSLGGNF